MPHCKGTTNRFLVASLSTLIIGTAISGLFCTQTATAATLNATTEATLKSAVTSATSGDTIDISGAPNSTITLTSPLILEKDLTLQGGTLLINGDFKHIEIRASLTLTLDDFTVKGRKTSPTDRTPGGGIYITPFLPIGTYTPFLGNTSIVGTGTSIISDNYTSNSGGGISGGIYGATLRIDNLSILNNTCGGNGGGVGFEGTTYFVSGTISGNSTSGGNQGGGISSAGPLYIMGGTISNNTAPGGSGGGIVTHSSIYMSGGLIDNNTSYGNGGGIYASAGYSGSSINITGGTISNNRTTSQDYDYGGGGGIYVSYLPFNMSGGTIEYNVAEGGGGGIANAAGNFQTVISGDAKIQYNQSKSTTLGGGGIYVGDNIQAFTIEDNASINNNTSANYGGGIYINLGNPYGSSSSSVAFNINSGAIANNTATYGGGIYFNAPPLSTPTLNIGAAATISDNTANMNGGGIYMNTDTLNFAGTIADNTAIGDITNILNGGGGIFLSTDTTVAVKSTAVLTGNSVTNGRGGAIYVQTFPQLTTEAGATFGNNSAVAVPWLITDNDMSMQATIATYNTQIKSTTHSTLTGSDNIYNGYDVNFAANIANEPIINEPVLLGAKTISGTSDMPAGTTITVYFRNGDGDPDNNPRVTTTVKADGTWEVTIPSNVILIVGHTIEATADTPDLIESTADDAVVITTPPADDPQPGVGLPNTGVGTTNSTNNATALASIVGASAAITIFGLAVLIIKRK